MSCEFYKFDGGFFGGDYYCIKQEKAVSTDTYNKYCRDYNYRECSIFKHTESSGCFLTTIVCQILGKKDNDEILANFRIFRDNILQPNQKYHDILKEYDVIGPMLVDCISNDNDKEKLATCLYNNVMGKINTQIKQKQYDEAVESYYIMTLSLINYYGLKHEYNQIKDNNYEYTDFDPKTAGHGLRLKRTKIKPNQMMMSINETK